jgi:hypothetical protein
MGWDTLKDGVLLQLAQERFDVFLTIDRSLEYQQNLRKFSLGFCGHPSTQESNLVFRTDPDGVTDGRLGSKSRRGRPHCCQHWALIYLARMSLFRCSARKSPTGRLCFRELQSRHAVTRFPKLLRPEIPAADIDFHNVRENRIKVYDGTLYRVLIPDEIEACRKYRICNHLLFRHSISKTGIHTSELARAIYKGP